MHDLTFHSQEEFDEYVRKALEESEREAADPNVKAIPWEEHMREAEAYLKELERHCAVEHLESMVETYA